MANFSTHVFLEIMQSTLPHFLPPSLLSFLFFERTSTFISSTPPPHSKLCSVTPFYRCCNRSQEVGDLAKLMTWPWPDLGSWCPLPRSVVLSYTFHFSACCHSFSCKRGAALTDKVLVSAETILLSWIIAKTGFSGQGLGNINFHYWILLRVK